MSTKSMSQPDAGDEQIYVVTAYTERETLQPTTFNVTAEDAEAAETKVEMRPEVTEVLSEMTSPFTGTFKLSLEGDPSAITETLDTFERAADAVEADVTIEDVTPTVWPANGDLSDEDALNAAVDDWDDLELRVVGNDIEERGRVMSVTPASVQAHGNTMVEVVAGDTVLVRAVLADDDGGEAG